MVPDPQAISLQHPAFVQYKPQIPPSTVIASRFKAFHPSRIQIADTMPRVMVQVIILEQRMESRYYPAPSPPL